MSLEGTAYRGNSAAGGQSDRKTQTDAGDEAREALATTLSSVPAPPLSPGLSRPHAGVTRKGPSSCRRLRLWPQKPRRHRLQGKGSWADKMLGSPAPNLTGERCPLGRALGRVRLSPGAMFPSPPPARVGSQCGSGTSGVLQSKGLRGPGLAGRGCGRNGGAWSHEEPHLSPSGGSVPVGAGEPGKSGGSGPLQRAYVPFCTSVQW